MKVLIADGSVMVTDRVLTLLDQIPNIELLGPTSDAHDTLESIRLYDPEVLIVDVCIPGAKVMELLPTIRQEKPGTILIILTNFDYPEYRKPLELLGADLCLDKSHEFVFLFRIIHELARISFEMGGPPATAGLRKQLAPAKLRVGLPCSRLELSGLVSAPDFGADSSCRLARLPIIERQLIFSGR
jgi:DNA-binding NarL/FixJ family response regulator